MPLFLGDKYKIESDELNITVYQKVDKTSEKSKRLSKMWADKGVKPSTVEKWNIMGYYPDIKSALHSIVGHGIKDTELKDVETIMGKINELHTMIDNFKIPDVITKRHDGRGRPPKHLEIIKVE
jgi:hypothetical protein